MNQVLVVNDDDVIRDRTATMLVNMGWEVYVATSEDKAFESLVARRPDMLIADIEMERGAGFEAIASAHRLFNSVFIVAASRGSDNHLWSEGAIACGAHSYIVGPVSRAKLAAAINVGFEKGMLAREIPLSRNCHCH